MANSAREWADIQPLRDQRLTRAVDHCLQWAGAVVLFWIQTFAVASNAMLVNQGEAEAALTRGNDEALQWSEGLGKRANGTVKLMMICHYVEVPALDTGFDPCIL